ncbi:hypothetical protein ANCDUO_10551 [Ancylostoma duodenale]|uniref:Uncharacterized protein n=1 Tax=Ancylostoma duodenale TaxID=51022 RepID=A0A0C2GK38_9BILA|nr:hypothetical protein ANCDUO_10551 [Ancylostoma duodenale]
MKESRGCRSRFRDLAKQRRDASSASGMIETECFQELNVFFEEDGSLVPSLRPDGQMQLDKKNGSSSAGFFSRLFKRKLFLTD